MGSNGRQRLQDIAVGTTPEGNAPVTNSGLPAIGHSYGQNWNSGNNIWGTAIGSGLRGNSNETQGRSSALGNGDTSGNRPFLGTSESNEAITGSGSLLASSESEGYVRRGSSQWPALPALSNGLANNQHTHGNASPVRPRTNQNTRSNSPFTNGQLASVGANGHGSRSMLDPRSQSFTGDVYNNSFEQPATTRFDDQLRRQQFSSNFNGLGSNGVYPFSGYSSSAASRSGSLPPSRHGHEPNGSVGDVTFPSMMNGNADIFGSRLGQQSRPNLPNQAAYRSRNGQGWNQNINELAVNMDRLELDQDPGQLLMSHQAMPPSPSRPNGIFNPHSGPRNGSISFDSDYRIGSTTAFRGPYMDRATHSPTDSDARRGHDSPFVAQTPPAFEHNRAPSNVSIRSNLGPSFNNQEALQSRLMYVAEQQQMQQNQLHQSQQGLGQFRQGYYGQVDLTPQILARIGAGGPLLSGPSSVTSYSSHQTQNPRIPPRGPAAESSSPAGQRSALLEEFRAQKNTRRFELRDIYGYVTEFSGDQHGSRFIQQKLEAANSDEKAQLFTEILPNAYQLTRDVFGNYVIQKLFEYGNQMQKAQLADKLRGQIPSLSKEMYACRVVQKAFEYVLTDQQAGLVKELEPHVLNCVKDQNGNHVIQKAIQRIPSEHIMFIIDAFIGQVQPLAMHTYGCRVVQRLLEHCPEPKLSQIIEEFHACSLTLITDQYGNYVAQHVIENGRPEDREKVIKLTLTDVIVYSKHKFASNVVEKCIMFGSPEQVKIIVDAVTTGDELYTMVGHDFGNYVIQKLLKELDGDDYATFVEKLQIPLTQARRQSYGRQIGQIEKLIETQKSSKRNATRQSTAPTVNGGSVGSTSTETDGTKDTEKSESSVSDMKADPIPSKKLASQMDYAEVAKGLVPNSTS